jgi:hypothetical protein
MSTDSKDWIELDISDRAGVLYVAARDGAGVRVAAKPFGPAMDRDHAMALADRIASAAAVHGPMTAELLEGTKALYEALFIDKVREAFARARERARDKPLVVRFIVDDAALATVPWEAAYEPGRGHLGSNPNLLVVRMLATNEPSWMPREVGGPIRILLIAATNGALARARLEEAVGGAVSRGEIELLEPIIGEATRWTPLQSAFRKNYPKAPHIVHFVGHGGAVEGQGPVLELGERTPEAIRVEAIEAALSQSFKEALCLVVLESCDGAKATDEFRSAAEELAKQSSLFALGHLWPASARAARAASQAFYETLCGTGPGRGDVASALGAARLALDPSAAAWSPAVVMRHADTRAFLFPNRRVQPPQSAVTGPPPPPDPALATLFGRPGFSFLVGDRAELRSQGRAELRKQLLAKLGMDGSSTLALSALAQRFALKKGVTALSTVLQATLMTELKRPDAEIPPFIEEIARHLRPGVHGTLLWLPSLETALAKHHPNRRIFVVQPPVIGAHEARILGRENKTWEEKTSLNDLALGKDFLVLRLYGGYLPEDPAFGGALVSEDDHLHGIKKLDEALAPDDHARIMSVLRSRPTLVVGTTLLKWRHRTLFRWLFNNNTPPKPSVAVMPTNASEEDVLAWSRAFATTEATAGVHVVKANLDALAATVSLLPVLENG